MKQTLNNVLIVDDNKDIRELIRRLLLNDGNLKIFEAADGLEALNIYLNENIDLIITDNDMPKIKGIILSKIINILHRSPPCPVIIMSGNHVDPDDLLDIGTVAFIEKPFIVKKLKTVIEDAFEDAAFSVQSESVFHKHQKPESKSGRSAGAVS